MAIAVADTTVEMVSVELFDLNLVVSCIYIAPNSCDTYRNLVLSSISSIVSRGHRVIITGD